MVNGIKYLNEVLGNYLQYNVKTNINLSKSVRSELDKESSEVLIWQNRNDNLICVSSKEKYYEFLNNEICRYRDIECKGYKLPVILFKIEDKEKIEQILDALNEEDYLTRLTNLINVLDNQKVLKRK